MKTYNAEVKTIKAKDIQARTKPEPVAEASNELADSDGDSLSISDSLRRIQDLLLEFIELVKEHGHELK